MERMIPPTRWNGLAWLPLTLLGSARKAMERSYLISWGGIISVHPKSTTACPQTQRVRLVRLSLFGWLKVTFLPLPFLPRQGQAMENACESAQTETAQATIQEEPKSRCFTQDTWSSRARGYIRDGYTRPGELVGFKTSHQRSQSTGCVLVRKAQTNTVADVIQVNADCDGTTNGPNTWEGMRCQVHLARL